MIYLKRIFEKSNTPVSLTPQAVIREKNVTSSRFRLRQSGERLFQFTTECIAREEYPKNERVEY